MTLYKKVMSYLLLVSAHTVLSQYPICISLGDACGPAMTLRDLGIRKEAYPFDWIVSSHEALYSVLIDDFQFFLENLTMRPGNQGVIDHYGFHFTHDWPTMHNPNIDALNADFIGNCELYPAWQQALPLVRQKYRKRIARLKQACSGSNKVIFVRSEFIGIPATDPVKAANLQNKAIAIRDFFASKYPALDFILIFISNESSFMQPWHIDRIRNFYSEHWHDPAGLRHMLQQVDPVFNTLRRVSNVRARRSELELMCPECIELEQ